jgi:Tol biopolymer transport system component
LYGEKRNRSEDEHYARPLTSGAVFVDMKMRKQKKVGANLQQGRWSPDGKRIAFLRKYDVWLWEPQSGRQKQASHLYLEDPKAEGSNSSTGVVEFAWIERGQAIATHESRLHGTGCNDISALDLPADKIQLLSSCRFAGCRHSLSSTPEGAVSWIEGDEVRVHDGKTSSSVSIGNEETCRYYSDSEWDIIEGRSGSLAWSPDGKHIAVYKQDLGILDAATGKELRVLPNAKNAFWLNATDFLYAGQKGIYSYRLGDASGKLIVLGGSISRQSRILLKEQRALSQDGRNTR